MAIGPNDKTFEFTDDSASNGNPQNGSFSPFDDKFNTAPQRPTRVRRFLDSFKPDSNAQMTFHSGPRDIEGGNKGYDVEAAAAATAQSPLARKLKGRHLQMIAIGGSVGTFILGDLMVLIRWVGKLMNFRNRFVRWVGSGTC